MISVEVSTPNSVSIDDVVNRVEVDITTTGTSGGGGGGGGGDHGGLTGLLDDDHPQYQRADSVFTSSASYTITDQSLVVSSGSTVILPDAASNTGRAIGIGSASGALTVTAAGADTIHGYGSTYTVLAATGRQFISINISGTQGWAVFAESHSTLNGLTNDDHPQYQRADEVFTTSNPYTVPNGVSFVATTGSVVNLPNAATNAGRNVTVAAAAGTAAVSPSGTDTIFGSTGSVNIAIGNNITFTAIEISSAWGWVTQQNRGNQFDLPEWFGQGIADGNLVTLQSGVPAWTTGTRTAEEFLSGTGWTYDVPVLVPVKNTSAGTIAKGAPVYATGTVGSTSTIEIAPTDADNAATMPAIGLTNSSLAVNATGYVTVVGTIRGVNTAAYAINQPLYVSTTAGQLTGTKPTGASELIQNVGRVTRVNSSTGEILVLGAGRTNDVPNAIDAGKLTSGTVGTARLGTGTANSTTWLRGDQTWAEPTPWEVITDTTASVATATFSVTVTGYTDIEVMITGIGDSASASLGMRVQFNGDTGSNYLSNNAAATTSWNGVGSMPGSLTNTDRNGIWRAAISLGGSGRYTAGVYQNGFVTSTATTGLAQGSSSGSAYYINTSAAITTMSIFLSAGNFATGTRLLVRGK